MKNTALLRRRILGRRASVGVLGQGFVGVSLACAAAAAGFGVTGIDTDPGRIEDLQRGVLSLPGMKEKPFKAGIESERLRFTTEPDALGTSDVVLICLPTPARDHTLDLSLVEQGTREVAARLSPGTLVCLESTVYPGTTDELVRPILESSGLRLGRDFLLAYAPERLDPGNEEFDLSSTPKLVGGSTPEGTGVAALFYGQFVDKVTLVSSCRAAELANLLESTFRHVNVALVNEMAMLCHDLNIDVWEVIDAAATKPFGFMPFYPGPGVGGDCIFLDMAHMAWQERRDGEHQFRILEQAQDINAEMPGYVAARIGEALNEMGKSLKRASILVLGVSYKPDVGDIRESPALKAMADLDRRGAKVSFHDPYVAGITVNGAYQPRSDLTRRTVESADCVAILTPHRVYDLDWIVEHSALVFDARNAYRELQHPKVVKL
jgi:nucleotide sugar dehydrogenase